MSILWLTLWTLALTVTWLVPNHFPPWSTFHTDAWVAVVSLLGASAVVFRGRQQPVVWPPFAWVALALAAVPWLQWATGLLYFGGQAWMSSAYLLGLALAVVVGFRWERAFPGQPGSAVLTAAAIAGVASVGLQLLTWLGLHNTDITSIWSMGLVGERPYANMGQPNVLASLLLWGLLATLMGYQFRFYRGSVAVLVAVFLLVGLALTQSRSGQLSLTLILTALWLWRSQWRARSLPWVATGLYVAFWTLLVYLPEVTRFLLVADPDSYLRGVGTGEARLAAWRVLGSAALERPLWGYGLTEVAQAQFQVANSFPALGTVFGQSHNLFLDFVLWLGLPLGLALTAFICWWVITTARALQTNPQRIAFLAVGVLGVHAMLELPLHHAFFLIPTGLLVGVLSTCCGYKWQLQSPWWPLVALWLMAAVAVTVTVRDYFRVESSFYALRFEKARINLPVNGIGEPPDVWALTHMKALIWAERYEPKPGATVEELRTLDTLARRFPSPGPIYRAAKTYALNGRSAEATVWLGKLCKFSDERSCFLIQGLWKEESEKNPGMAAVAWPQD